MPKKKFGPDDIFHNTVKTYPQYDIEYYFNQSYINNRQTQGNRVQSGSISLYELNVDREVGVVSLIHPFITKNENEFDFVFTNVTGNLSTTEYNQLPNATDIESAYPLTSSVSRELLIGAGAGPSYTSFQIIDGVSYENSIYKIYALENTLNKNQIYSPKFDYDKYYIDVSSNNGEFNNKGTVQSAAAPWQKYMSLFVFPEIFKAQKINPGSVELNYYITGTLLASAKDTNRNGEIIETYGPRVGSTIGTVSYAEGVMIITGNYDLNSTVEDGYLCPVTGTTTTNAGPGKVTLQSAWKDNPKWAHFGAYKSFIQSSDSELSRSYAPFSSSYELKFEGTNVVPTLTMFCHADKNEMNWSNNLSYLDRSIATGSTYQEIVVAQTGSVLYKEKEYIPVKNTISSSFDNYSASYQDQTFISKINILDKDGNIIAIAKMAKPVTKTNNTDYTFKLKIDL
ncbi:MAG: hypothetical protein RLZZ337_1493 [Bacteroidota bacterium]|jgi:hypothetical protein